MKTRKRFLKLQIYFFCLIILTILCLTSSCSDDNNESPYIWTQTLLSGKDWSQSMNSIASDNEGRLISVGVEEQRAAVWLSQDGETWTQPWNDSQGDEVSLMNDVIYGDASTGYIAVGQQNKKAVIWTSSDGNIWNKIYNYQQPSEASFSEMKAITKISIGYVAVGWTRQFTPPVGSKIVAAVWISSDGLSWRRIEHNDQVFLGPTYMASAGEGGGSEEIADIQMMDVIATEVGITAIGWSDQENYKFPSAWISTDGISWSRPWCLSNMQQNSRYMNGQAYALIKHESRLIAVGTTHNITATGGFDGVVWYSDDDGISWQRVEGIENIMGGPGVQSLNAVIACNDGIIAAGINTDRENDANSFIWNSTDGIAWSPVASNSTWNDSEHLNIINGLIQRSQGCIAIGLTLFIGRENYHSVPYQPPWSEADYDAAVWLSDTPTSWRQISCNDVLCRGKADQRLNDIALINLNDEEAEFVIVGSEELNGDIDPAVWICQVSAGSNRLSSCIYQPSNAFYGPGNQIINGVTRGENRLVAVGSDDINGDLDVAAWVSSSGRNWVRVFQPGVFSGIGDQEALSVAYSNGYFVAVGRRYNGRDYDGAIWYSSDGDNWERGSGSILDTFGGESHEALYDIAEYYEDGSPQGFIIVGDSLYPNIVPGITSTRVWKSNGTPTNWNRITSNAFSEGNNSMRAIATKYKFVAVGTAGRSRDGHSMVANWISEDLGNNWTIHKSYSTDSNLSFNDVATGEIATGVADPMYAFIAAICGTEKLDDHDWNYGYITRRLNDGRWYSCNFGESGRNQMVKGIILNSGNPIVVGSEERQDEIDGAIWFFTENPEFTP